MLVKKIHSDWQPSENPGLQIGETLEVTDPRSLIVGGLAVGVDSETGMELSAFDLYGEIIESELEEFRAWKAMQKQEALKKHLEAEKAELEAKLATEAKKEVSTATTEATSGESTTATEAQASSLESLTWNELIAKGKEKGVYKVGMSREKLLAALK